ncbi:MAG: DUF6390 family protein, partial [Candidatus Dormibacteraceae bacterium]
MTAVGALRFGRYAFPPNRLGYCGPTDHEALLGYVASRTVDQGLVELERRFEGAYPYLVLIARANGITDPFDERVVEAYWIGNQYLESVDGLPFSRSLGERFQPRMRGTDFGWLTTKLELGARPHHNFHVFEVYTRAGLMRNEAAAIALETMDSCRISWGTVTAVVGDELLVERPELVLHEGKLALSEARQKRVTRQLSSQGFVDGVGPG